MTSRGMAVSRPCESAPPAERSSVGLLGGDLMVSSRLQTLVGRHGLSFRQVVGGDLSDLRLLLVDLNRQQDLQLERLREIAASAGAPKVLAFGPHLLMRDLRERARQAGADRVVANSALPAVLERLLGGGPPPQPMRESAGE